MNMPLDLTAKNLEHAMEQFMIEQDKLLSDCEQVLAKYAEMLRPMTDVMGKYGVVYKNPTIKGCPESTEGVIVGFDGEPLYVYRDGLVYNPDPMPVPEFLKTANLEQVKAGFKYVFSLQIGDAVKPQTEKNAELKAFLKAVSLYD